MLHLRYRYLLGLAVCNLAILLGIVVSSCAFAGEKSVRLSGVISFGSDRAAIIEDEQTGIEEVITEGAVLSGDMTVVKIRRDRLVLRKNGALSELFLLEGGVVSGGTQRDVGPIPASFAPDAGIASLQDARAELSSDKIIEYLLPSQTP